MKKLVYKGAKTRVISFPLGGIGAGSVGLAGNGRLIDWEIFNKPNKGSFHGFSHLAIKAEKKGKTLDARVLHGDLEPPYTGESLGPFGGFGFGFGPHRSTLTGLPHFREVEFMGEYPFAQLRFKDKTFPGSVALRAFNPLIPLNEDDSSLPAAFFEVDIVNPTKDDLDYTVGFTLANPLTEDGAENTFETQDGVQLLRLGMSKYGKEDLKYGEMAVATDAEQVSYQQYWYRGQWFDNLGVYWQDFIKPGRLSNRVYPEQKLGQGKPITHDHGMLAAHVRVKGGASTTVRFVMSWYFPNCNNYWNPTTGDAQDNATPKPEWRNYYASLFDDAGAVACYGLKEWSWLYGETKLYKDALFSTTADSAVLDAVSANVSILKSPTCLRLEDGSFYGWEGCDSNAGCCDGTCTHVWGYAYALPFLFPRLERSVRELHYRYNMREDGWMRFRLPLPLGREIPDNHACVDGQMGEIFRVYRDWKISGDDEWLTSLWPKVKTSLEFAWVKSNPDHWDADKDGVMEGRQHHTLDMELYGPNSWLTSMYLAALKAASEMADYLDDDDKAQEYRELFEQGKAWVDKHLFNGRYYHQRIDLADKAVLEKYTQPDIFGRKALDTYWSEEHNQVKYQIHDGCGVDQVLGQWHANLCGLGEVLDRKKVKKALRAIYQYNFCRARDVVNPCRIYSTNDERGVFICTWPKGSEKPVIPAPYSEETMNGFEYQAACHMIQEGMVEEGLKIVAAIRERYDGEKRNPWNEFECGSNYARSMASYALLNALSGFEYDLVAGMVGFSPVTQKKGKFRTFWSLGSGWGVYEQKADKAILTVLRGELKLKELRLGQARKGKLKAVTLGKAKIAASLRKGAVIFDDAIIIPQEMSLTVRWE